MREILFRGRCNEVGKYNGHWIEGHYGEDEGRNEIFFSTKIGTVGYSCEPESIGQYTGLTDKNGKKIFEGDICRMKADRLKGYGAIIFMGSAFVLCDKTHKKTRYYPLYPDGQFTVVGNVHDNPELLEVTK